MSVITSIGIANPPYCHLQENILKFMVGAAEGEKKTSQKLNAIYRKSSIDSRYSALPDYTSGENGRNLFPDSENLEPFPGIAQRMKLFAEEALPLSLKSVEHCLESVKDKIDKKEITHLITVTCTGLSAPGLDIEIMKDLGLNNTIHRTSVNFMGCYAALHALKYADAICKAEQDAVVLIVSTELCTLHFQKDTSDDHLIANSLFADGSSSVLIVSDEVARKKRMNGLKTDSFYSEIAFDGNNDMAWKISETGFLMTLTTSIPNIIEGSIKQLIGNALEKHKIQKKEIKHWAIHPGGKRILEVIEKELELDQHTTQPSYDVLRNYGNMSSPTILFVLKSIWDNRVDWKKDESVLAVAFGPGLTMETLILSNVVNEL